MIFLYAIQEAPEIPLVFARSLMLFLLEWCVFDVCTTVFAPVLGLWKGSA